MGMVRARRPRRAPRAGSGAAAGRAVRARFRTCRSSRSATRSTRSRSTRMSRWQPGPAFAAELGRGPRRERGSRVPDAARAGTARAPCAGRRQGDRPVVGQSQPALGQSKRARLADLSCSAPAELPLRRSAVRRFAPSGGGGTRARHPRRAARRHRQHQRHRHLAALISACDAGLGQIPPRTGGRAVRRPGPRCRTIFPHLVLVQGGRVEPRYPRVHVRRQANGQPWRDLAASCVDDVSKHLKQS